MEKQSQRINISGFKSIKDQTIQFSSMNVLIGPNGAGKSNFISLFRFLRNIIEGRLNNTSLRAGAESLLYYGSKVTPVIAIELHFDHDNAYLLKLRPTNGDSLFIEQEEIISNYKEAGGGVQIIHLAYGERESFLSEKAKTEVNARSVYKTLENWRVYHFHDTGESAQIKKYVSMADNRILFEDASNLAPLLYVIKETQSEYYERIVKTIRLVIPFFNSFVLRPNLLNNENIRLEWTDKFSDKIFTANELSDGSLRFICMATLLLQKDIPELILLDEPELGLHPAAITILAGLLKKASKRAQIIVATQSVSLVNEFEAEDIIVVEKSGAETTFKRLDPEKLETWLDEYSLGELWDKNVFGGNP